MLDLFFRAETPATLRTVVRSAPFRSVIGDLRARDAEGKVTTGIVMLPGAVDWVYFAPNRVVITPAVLDGDGNVITPAVTDDWCWLQLRLYGDAETADFEDDPADVEPDRWNKSRIRKWMQDNGTIRTIRGVRVYEHTLGNGKRAQIWHGRDMAENAPPSMFHEYLGGNFYG